MPSEVVYDPSWVENHFDMGYDTKRLDMAMLFWDCTVWLSDGSAHSTASSSRTGGELYRTEPIRQTGDNTTCSDFFSGEVKTTLFFFKRQEKKSAHNHSNVLFVMWIFVLNLFLVVLTSPIKNGCAFFLVMGSFARKNLADLAILLFEFFFVAPKENKENLAGQPCGDDLLG